MKQLTPDSELRLLEQKLNNAIEQRLAPLENRVETLESPTGSISEYTTSTNYLPNSSFEWSTDAYTNTGVSPSTVSDANRNCYGWKYQTEAATDLSASSALLASGHTGYAGLNADAPVWDAVSAAVKMGSSSALYDIAINLPTNFVSPGRRFYVYLEASLASTSIDISDGLQFYCGFWDNTAGQRKWIEGSTFTPTASVYGAAGSRSLEYKILAETDSGDQILSNAITVATAPATLSSDNHVRLSFTGAPGFIYYGIYRKDGSVYRLVHEIRNSIDLQFFDMQESAGAIVAGYPSVTTQKPRAYAKTAEFEPGDLSSTAFAAHTLTVQVPLTYDVSATGNGQQWFRCGLDALAAAGDERGIVIRKICVSEGYGGWTRSPLDLQAASAPTTSASSAPAPTTPTTTPSSPGTGGINCVDLDTEIEVVHSEIVGGSRVEVVTLKPMRDVQKGDVLACGALSRIVQNTRTGTVATVYEIETENGLTLTCSESHRLITSRFDKQGRAVKFLKSGDYVLTCKQGAFVQSRISSLLPKNGSFVVKSIQLASPHLFIAGGFVSHNRKPNPDEI